MTAKHNTEVSESTASVRNVVVYSCAKLAMPGHLPERLIPRDSQ